MFPRRGSPTNNTLSGKFFTTRDDKFRTAGCPSCSSSVIAESTSSRKEELPCLQRWRSVMGTASKT